MEYLTIHELPRRRPFATMETRLRPSPSSPAVTGDAFMNPAVSPTSSRPPKQERLPSFDEFLRMSGLLKDEVTILSRLLRSQLSDQYAEPHQASSQAHTSGALPGFNQLLQAISDPSSPPRSPRRRDGSLSDHLNLTRSVEPKHSHSHSRNDSGITVNSSSHLGHTAPYSTHSHHEHRSSLAPLPMHQQPAPASTPLAYGHYPPPHQSQYHGQGMRLPHAHHSYMDYGSFYAQREPAQNNFQFQPHGHPPSERRRRGNLPREATNVLKTWYKTHRFTEAGPFPDEETKARLRERTNLSVNQVSNWFINTRRRDEGRQNLKTLTQRYPNRAEQIRRDFQLSGENLDPIYARYNLRKARRSVARRRSSSPEENDGDGMDVDEGDRST